MRLWCHVSIISTSFLKSTESLRWRYWRCLEHLEFCATKDLFENFHPHVPPGLPALLKTFLRAKILGRISKETLIKIGESASYLCFRSDFKSFLKKFIVPLSLKIPIVLYQNTLPKVETPAIKRWTLRLFQPDSHSMSLPNRIYIHLCMPCMPCCVKTCGIHVSFYHYPPWN